jgi:hypothetical protein
MSKIMRKVLANALSITATGIQAPIKLDDTPFMGGKGRSGYLVLQAAVGGSGSIKVQGHNGTTNGTDTPAEGDSGWYDIATLTSASPLSQEIELPLYIRTNVGVVGTGTITAWLDGVQ